MNALLPVKSTHLECESGTFECIYEMGTKFSNTQLEVRDATGVSWFKVTVLNSGLPVVRTFSTEIPADVMTAAIKLAARHC